jgi:hypothetical protein
MYPGHNANVFVAERQQRGERDQRTAAADGIDEARRERGESEHDELHRWTTPGLYEARTR